MQFSVLVRFITFIAALNHMTAKALPQLPLDSDSDLFQEVAYDDPTLVFSSSTVTDPDSQAGSLDAPEFPLPLLPSDDFRLTEALPLSNSDSMINLDSPTTNLLAGAASDNNNIIFVGNSCDDDSALFNKIKRDGGHCDATDTNSHDLNIDLLQKLGQGDSLWKLMNPASPPREEPELLENENKKMTLPGPYDIRCNPDYPFRLCCDGPYDLATESFLAPLDLLEYASMKHCTRSTFFFFFLFFFGCGGGGGC